MEKVVFVLIISYFAVVKLKIFAPKVTIWLARIFALGVAIILFIIAEQNARVAVQYNAMAIGAILVFILTPMFVIKIGPNE